MRRDEFTARVSRLVQKYIDNFDRFDSNPQIRVNPMSFDIGLINSSEMYAEIEDADEAVESAASAQGDESESASDYQVRQNPDFYAVKQLLRHGVDSKAVPDTDAISAIAASYPALH